MTAKPKKQASKTEEIPILEIERGAIEFCVLGTTPLIMNRISEKAKRELLFPKKKTAAEKKSTMKHNPPQEYRASPYKAPEDDSPSRLLAISTAFKGALRDVALDMPEVNKTEIGRLTYVKGGYRHGSYVHIYGIPELFMATVRMADAARTPDIRTRAIIPGWACRVSITYVIPLLRERAVANLFAAAGIMRGIGDWRPQKGSGDYGQFELVAPSDKRFKAIMKNGGLAAQDKALREPACYDPETAELLTWFESERVSRGFDENGIAVQSDKANGGIVPPEPLVDQLKEFDESASAS